MANSKRDQVILACSECKEHNYITTRNKKTHPNKLETMKYCKRCKKETLHKECK